MDEAERATIPPRDGNGFVDQALDHQNRDGGPSDACPLPFRLAGDAEQQKALGDAEAIVAIDRWVWSDRYPASRSPR